MEYHKSFQSTEIYINVKQMTFDKADNKSHIKVTNNLDEIKVLLQAGFEYICEKGCTNVF